MNADLVIRGGTLVTGRGETRAAVAVANGKIVAVDGDDAMPEARDVIDATGLHVLPGVIDTHTHFRDPGWTDKEDWLTGTQAAAASGVTTVIEMPVSVPPVSSVANLQARVASVTGRSIVDFAMYGGAAGDNLDDIEPLAQAGVVAYKSFRTRAFKGREAEFVGIACPSAGDFLQAMERTARTGLIHAVHAEEQQILDVTIARARATGRKDGGVHALAGAEVAETASVAQCLAIAAATGGRLQIAHMSASESIAMVRRARAAGITVTAETCPHYLMFTEDALERWGPYAKCNPPLRSEATQARLWEAVNDGTIDVIGTDHVPFVASDKAPYVHDIWPAPAGMPALEEFLPLMLTAVHQRRLTLSKMVQVTSENAARVFKLWPRKGNLSAGADADFSIVDLGRVWVHDHRALYTKAREGALMYDGMQMTGRPVMTIVRGRVVMRDGQVIGTPQWGQWIRP